MRTCSWMAMSLILTVILMTGCGRDSSAPAQAEKRNGAAGDHDHSGWWCNEHGVPEEVCGQCNDKLAAGFQSKRDWCREHERPDSQCFKCHPELEAKFAAQYEAKYGKKPPTPVD